MVVDGRSALTDGRTDEQVHLRTHTCRYTHTRFDSRAKPTKPTCQHQRTYLGLLPLQVPDHVVRRAVRQVLQLREQRRRLPIDVDRRSGRGMGGKESVGWWLMGRHNPRAAADGPRPPQLSHLTPRHGTKATPRTSVVAAAPSRGQASSREESFISISVKMCSSSEWSSSRASSSLSPATPSRHAFSRSAGQIRSSSAYWDAFGGCASFGCACWGRGAPSNQSPPPWNAPGRRGGGSGTGCGAAPPGRSPPSRSCPRRRPSP